MGLQMGRSPRPPGWWDLPGPGRPATVPDRDTPAADRAWAVSHHARGAIPRQRADRAGGRGPLPGRGAPARAPPRRRPRRPLPGRRGHGAGPVGGGRAAVARSGPALPTVHVLGEDGDRWTWETRMLGGRAAFRFGDRGSLPREPLDWVGRQVVEDLIVLSGDAAAGFPSSPASSASRTTGRCPTSSAGRCSACTPRAGVRARGRGGDAPVAGAPPAQAAGVAPTGRYGRRTRSTSRLAPGRSRWSTWRRRTRGDPVRARGASDALAAARDRRDPLHDPHPLAAARRRGR